MGYKKNENGEMKIVVNPDKAGTMRFRPEDKIIVIAEDGDKRRGQPTGKRIKTYEDDAGQMQYGLSCVIFSKLISYGSRVRGTDSWKSGLPVRGKEIKILRVAGCAGQTAGSQDYP